MYLGSTKSHLILLLLLHHHHHHHHHLLHFLLLLLFLLLLSIIVQNLIHILYDLVIGPTISSLYASTN